MDITTRGNGLVLTAGGARGAYQAGVLARLGEISALKNKPSPFAVIAGASAGALNGSMLAAHSDDFEAATRAISKTWSEVQFDDVFKTGIFALGSLSTKWALDLTLGGIIGGGRAQSLLDASPLRAHLAKVIPFERIAKNIENGHLYALGITATNYLNGKSFTFIEGKSGHPMWSKSRRESIPMKITVDHVCASSAIPIVFQPVPLELPTGRNYFGDGGLRLVAPFSPAIRLGASRIFAIGIRSLRSAQTRLHMHLTEKEGTKINMKAPPLAQIFGVALNSMFLDHLQTDYDHLTRINELISEYRYFREKSNEAERMKEPMRVVQPMILNPSVDLAVVAENHTSKMPRMVRYMMEGLGTSMAQSADLMSYMLFDSGYARALIDVGYKDASDHIDEIESFLRG